MLFIYNLKIISDQNIIIQEMTKIDLLSLKNVQFHLLNLAVSPFQHPPTIDLRKSLAKGI